jgi:hypothetical protein
MTTPEREKRRFEGIVELAQWATAKAIGTAFDGSFVGAIEDDLNLALRRSGDFQPRVSG